MEEVIVLDEGGTRGVEEEEVGVEEGGCNLVVSKATETGFLCIFFECYVMFEAEDSNLQFKFVGRRALEENMVVVCTEAFC